MVRILLIRSVPTYRVGEGSKGVPYGYTMWRGEAMRIHRKIIPVLALFILFSVPVFMGGNAQAATGMWEVFELPLATSNSYSNEYTDVTLTATFTAPSSNIDQLINIADRGPSKSHGDWACPGLYSMLNRRLDSY